MSGNSFRSIHVDINIKEIKGDNYANLRSDSMKMSYDPFDTHRSV